MKVRLSFEQFHFSSGLFSILINEIDYKGHQLIINENQNRLDY